MILILRFNGLYTFYLSNADVMQTNSVELDLTAIHLVAWVSLNAISIEFYLRSLGKFVPLIVKLSAPRIFNSYAG